MLKPYLPNKVKTARSIDVGGVKIGGGEPVRVQSMTNTDTRDTVSTINQINELTQIGCELIRVAVPDEQAAQAVGIIKSKIAIPLIADIHFNNKLAVQSLINGADAVRINPGNIGGAQKTAEVIRVAKDLGKAVRIGVNAGSLDKKLLSEYGVSSQALVLSAMKEINVLESMGFYNYKVSLKASSVPMTVETCGLFNVMCDAPLHIGITEAGTVGMGTVKSAAGIGTLLMAGIGDTIRVSLTADPKDEIKVAWNILNATGVRRRGVEIISCPTCGRTEIDLISLASAVEQECARIDKQISVAVMGCAVNGPGEAREADYGIAGGKGEGIIFKKGEIIKKVKEEDLLKELIEIIINDPNF